MAGSKRVAALIVLALAVALGWWRCRSDHATQPSVADATARIVGRAKSLRDALATIRGTVSNEQGAAIAGAHVCAKRMGTPHDWLRAPDCAIADGRGAFEIGGVVAARYVVSAMAKTYRPANYVPVPGNRDEAFDLHATEQRAGVDITLRTGGVEITGVISDLGGGPIPHAAVRAEAANEDDVGVAMADADNAGRYSMWVAPGAVYIGAMAEGYVHTNIQGVAPGTFDIALTPGGSISGTVVDGVTNRPIAGIDVATERRVARDASGNATDDQGRFTIDRLGPGRYVVHASQTGQVGMSEGSTLLALGQSLDGVIVKVFPALRVGGRVAVATSNTPCAKPWLRLMSRFGSFVYAEGKPDGTVFADELTSGTYSVEAGCEGFASRMTYPSVDVVDKDILGLTWSVDRGATIRGRVLTRSGTPIAAIDVDAGGWTESDREGRYEITGVGAGEVTFGVRSRRWAMPLIPWTVTVKGQETIEKDLVLDETGTIRGVVVDREAHPVAHAEVSTKPLATYEYRGWNSALGSTETGADGGFEFHVPSGDYQLTLSRDDEQQQQHITVRAPNVTTVQLVVETRNGTIRGSVVDSSSAPIADAYVSVARELEGSPANLSRTDGVMTAVDGSFAVSKLAPGSYSVRAFRKGGGEALVEHIAVGSVARITIARTGAIEGTVVPVGAELFVTARETTTQLERSELFTHTNGHYTIRDLPPGRYVVTAMVDPRRAEANAVLAAGEHKTVDINLDGGVTVTGRVIDLATKLPVAGMRMSAGLDRMGAAYDQDRVALTDSAGRFRIERVATGLVQVGGSQDGYSWAGLLRTVDHDTDVGDIGVVKARVVSRDDEGTLGIEWLPYPDDTPSDQRTFTVKSIDPSGPAAGSGLQIGDVVMTVDGIDAHAANRTAAWTLLTMPAGTTVQLGLARAVTVSIVTAKH